MTQQATETAEQRRIRELEVQLTQLRLQQTPENQRPLLQREMELERREQAIAGQQSQIATQAKQVYADKLHRETGIPVEDLMQHATVEAMNGAALTAMRETLADPAKMRKMADFMEQLKQTGASPPALVAPGAETAPAGTGGQPGGTQSMGADYLTQVTTAMKGKGSESLAEWLQAARTVPLEEFSFAPESAMPGPQFQSASPAPAG